MTIYRAKWRIVCLGLCMLSSILSMQAQTTQEIQNSPEYVWGEGFAVTAEEAEQNALSQMSRSISVSIFNKTAMSETNGDAFQQRVLQSVSSARLQNVQVRVLSEEPKAHVFCYMHRDEVKRMYEKRMERIKDMVEAGKTAEERLQIDDALRYYYWALLLSRSNPQEVNISFGSDTGFASTLLPLKIKSVIQGINAELIEGQQENSSINALINFSYNGKKVSSLQFNYNDGQSFVGPVHVKDGIGEVDLLSFPSNGKLSITYETRFKNEVDPLDGELLGLYSSKILPTFNTSNELAIKLNGNKVKAGKKANNETQATKIAPQPTKNKKPIEMRPTASPDILREAVLTVETAIREGDPQIAYQQFTPEGYKLFSRLMNDAGKITLSGKSEYEFIDADGYVIGRSTRIKIKFKSGKTFIENLVYRFNSQSKKIESIAFALTKVAENDIMNAAASWPEISRWAILNFMEDYQTAFALKRLDYISGIFSDGAIIVTGSIIKNIDNVDHIFDKNKIVKFEGHHGAKNVVYSRHTKKEYIQRLDELFKKREFVHLTFENNVTKLIDLPSVVTHGAAFGIEIKQRYSSSTYSDEGYLTLIFDTRGKHPIIHVRFWQPDKTDMMSLQEFISIFSN